MKKGLILGDLHAGHTSSLVLSGSKFRRRDCPKDPVTQMQDELEAIFMAECVKKHKNPDFLITTGDLVDGKATRKGGVQLLTADRAEQVEIATQVLKALNPKKVYGVLGTPYHSGKEEDWEQLVAAEFDTQFKDALDLQIEDVIFHVQHKIGNSSIPHGVHTPIAKDRLIKAVNGLHKGTPQANVIVRGHVHRLAGAYGPGWEGFTCSALMADVDKYGTRECKSDVHFGFSDVIVIKDRWYINHHVYVLESTQPKLEVLG